MGYRAFARVPEPRHLLGIHSRWQSTAAELMGHEMVVLGPDRGTAGLAPPAGAEDGPETLFPTSFHAVDS